MFKWIVMGLVVLVVVGAAIISECYEDGWAAGYCEGMRKAEEIHREGREDGKERKEESA